MNLKLTQHQCLFFISLITIFLFSIGVQSSVLLSWDVSWGLHEARKLLAGGIYGKEIFEASPPMFLYLYAPAIWLSDYASINIVTAIRTYLYFLSTLSLCLCYFSISKIFAQNHLLKTIMLLAIAASFVLLPLPYDTAQREHILFILTLPYFLHTAVSLSTSEKFSNSYIIAIGFLAGLGFAVKPFFILPFILIETFYAYQTRNIFSWFRKDALTILFISLFHVIYICLAQPDYFKTIAPLFLHFYYQGYSSDWISVMFHPAMLFCEFAVLFFISEYVTNPYKTFSIVLLIAMLGFAGSHIMQRTFWYYHLYPAFSSAMLLTILLYSLFVTRIKKPFDYMAGGILCGFLFLFLAANVPDFIVSLVGFRLITGIFFSALMCFMTILLFTTKEKLRFGDVAFTLFFGISIFTFPYHFAHTRYLLSANYKQNMQPLITFLHNFAEQKPVYFFSAAMSTEFPAVDYANAIHVSRYPALIWLPGMLNQTQQTLDFTNDIQLKKINNYFMDSVANEIKQHKPHYIFVDTLAGLYLKKPFPYINYFLTNTNFKTEWQSYHYFATIDGGPYFRYNVFQRIET